VPVNKNIKALSINGGPLSHILDLNHLEKNKGKPINARTETKKVIPPKPAT